jgi:hypothetical protein
MVYATKHDDRKPWRQFDIGDRVREEIVLRSQFQSSRGRSREAHQYLIRSTARAAFKAA